MAVSSDEESSLCAQIAGLQRRIQDLEAEVTEHERTRMLLREDHSFRVGVIERAAEGICVCHGIEEAPFVRFTVWNRRMTQITGYTMDIINRRGWYQTMYPDPEVQQRARERMLEMRDGDDLQYERWEVARADGQRRTLGISTSLLITDDGLTHALGLMQDVTDEEKYRLQMEGRVERLEGLLPICASCKKIRDTEGAWHHMETYIRDRSDAEFTHGICSECAVTLYGDFLSD